MLALKDSKGGANEYKPSTLPPQIISLGIKGKYLSATDSIEVNVVFNNIAQNALIYLQDYILTYKKNSIPKNPFDGKQELIPKVTSTTVSHTFNLPADYLGNVGFRVFPKNPDKMYQTANIPDVNSLMATFKKFVKPTFTGSHAYFSDANYEWMECYSNGTLEVLEGTYDVCLVGGGSNGRAGASTGGDRYKSHGGGGGSGEIKTQKQVKMSGNYNIQIGANESQTTVSGSNLSLQAKSGVPQSHVYDGGSGTSGGGIGGYEDTKNVYAPSDGGSDGSDGKPSPDPFKLAIVGKGIGTSKGSRLFGEKNQKLVAAGGSGANGSHQFTGAKGGKGGGGDGADVVNYHIVPAIPATPNTGSGGGGGVASNNNGRTGGSGLFVIRWRKVA